MVDGPDFALSVVALAFAGMGVCGLAAPHRITGQFDIPRLSANGRNEVRAVYGGFGLATSAALLWAVTAPDLRVGLCMAVAAALAGMAGGRIFSAICDRRMGRWPLVYLGVECVGASLLIYAA